MTAQNLNGPPLKLETIKAAHPKCRDCALFKSQQFSDYRQTCRVMPYAEEYEYCSEWEAKTE